MVVSTRALDVWGRVEIGARLVGGARSTLLHVLVDGRSCVARRVPFGEVEARWLFRVLRAAEAAGLVVPVPIPAPDGRFVVGGWTLEPLLQGCPGRSKDLEELLAVVTRFHARTVGFPPRPGQAAVRRRWPEALAARLDASWPVGRTTVVHGDLHPGNVLRLPNGQLALVDWEESRRDVEGVDLGALRGWRDGRRAHAAVELAACWLREPIRARAMARRLRLKG